MKYKIENEYGEIVARVNDPIDTGHIYKVYGPPYKIKTLHNRLLYPHAVDSPDWDTPGYISARVIERGLGKPSRRPASDVVGTRAPRVKRYEVGPNWRASKIAEWNQRKGYEVLHATTAEWPSPVPTQPPEA